MSEQHTSVESYRQQVETLEHEPRLEALNETSKSAELDKQTHLAEAARSELEGLQATTQETVNAAAETNPQQPLSAAQQVTRELKKLTLNQELRRVRRKLPVQQRALSKLVHQPIVRVVSESGAKTISRPSGLLGGGLVAFAGSSSYLYFAKHIGIQYNYLLFVLFFVGGFLIGLAAELLISAITANRRKAQS